MVPHEIWVLHEHRSATEQFGFFGGGDFFFLFHFLFDERYEILGWSQEIENKIHDQNPKRRKFDVNLQRFSTSQPEQYSLSRRCLFCGDTRGIWRAIGSFE